MAHLLIQLFLQIHPDMEFLSKNMFYLHLFQLQPGLNHSYATHLEWLECLWHDLPTIAIL